MARRFGRRSLSDGNRADAQSLPARRESRLRGLHAQPARLQNGVRQSAPVPASRRCARRVGAIHDRAGEDLYAAAGSHSEFRSICLRHRAPCRRTRWPLYFSARIDGYPRPARHQETAVRHRREPRTAHAADALHHHPGRIAHVCRRRPISLPFKAGAFSRMVTLPARTSVAGQEGGCGANARGARSHLPPGRRSYV